MDSFELASHPLGPCEVPPDPHEIFRKHDNALAADLIHYLEENRGKLTLEQCRFLFKKVNGLTAHLRHGEDPNGMNSLVALIIMLEGNVSARGPLDSLTEFVKAFGSPHAQTEYLSRPKHVPSPTEEHSANGALKNLEERLRGLLRLFS